MVLSSLLFVCGDCMQIRKSVESTRQLTLTARLGDILWKNRSDATSIPRGVSNSPDFF
jgi:hypothetical protein